jgi:hypothetical protein
LISAVAHLLLTPDCFHHRFSIPATLPSAQREIVTPLENAVDARRQRIILSQSDVNWIRWTCLLAQAVCVLLLLPIVHSDNPIAPVQEELQTPPSQVTQQRAVDRGRLEPRFADP